MSDREDDRRLLVGSFDDDLDLAREVAEAFRSHISEMVGALESAIEQKDVSALSDAAHSAKGAVSHFPAEHLYEALARFESLTDSSLASDAEDLLGDVRREISAFERRLDALW